MKIKPYTWVNASGLAMELDTRMFVILVTPKCAHGISRHSYKPSTGPERHSLYSCDVLITDCKPCEPPSWADEIYRHLGNPAEEWHVREAHAQYGLRILKDTHIHRDIVRILANSSPCIKPSRNVICKYCYQEMRSHPLEDPQYHTPNCFWIEMCRLVFGLKCAD